MLVYPNYNDRNSIDEIRADEQQPKIKKQDQKDVSIEEEKIVLPSSRPVQMQARK